MNVSIRITPWQKPTFAEAAQELARTLARQEAPVIALWKLRVRVNEQRREQAKKIAATARFVQPISILTRQAD